MLPIDNVKELILKRKSTRSYVNRSFTQDELFKIWNYINSSEYQKGIFDYVRFELVENKYQSVFGSYGEITGAKYYIAAIAKNTRESLLDVGFAFERFILFLESMGLGTCWLAATSFDRNAAELYTPLKGKEIIAAISPVGEKAIKRSEFEIAAREKYKSDIRLDFNDLFIDAQTGGRILNQKIRDTLEYVRLAPSALNNQPWRIAVDGNIAHFYVIRRFILHLNYDFQMIDIGAALCHYSEVTGKDKFFTDNSHTYKGLEYVLSL